MSRLLVASRREGIEVDGILYLANALALLPLLGGAAPAGTDLDLVKTVEDRAGRRVVIYRIAGAV